MNAPQTKISKLCRNCHHCNRIEKAKRLVKVFRQSHNEKAIDDVYEFAESEDDDIDTSRLSRRDQNQAQNVDEEDPLYLDMLPTGSPQIVQINFQDVRKKKIMRPRLVDKSNASKVANDFSLVEHENLLDQQIETLSQETPSEIGMTSTRKVSSSKLFTITMHPPYK